MSELRELSHTADVGFEIRAGSLEELFETAARGLVQARGADPASRAETSRTRVELDRPDLERLLVAWLRELLHRAGQEGAVPETEVEEVDTTGSGAAIRARVAWRAEDEAGPTREIKGVTYHGLAVERMDGGWHAQVVLDV